MKLYTQNKPAFMSALLLIAFVVVIGAGSTIAYYSAHAGNASNVFTFSENIRANLSEPNWDVDEGLKMVPGKEIRKDPMITNTCDIAEYVAIKLTFQYKDKTSVLSVEDYERLISLIDIDWNGEEWTVISGAGTPTQIYGYNTALSPGEVSSPVFNSVKVHTKAEGLTEEDLRWLQGIKIAEGTIVEDESALGGFNIKVEGAALQADGYTDINDAAPSLINLFS